MLSFGRGEAWKIGGNCEREKKKDSENSKKWKFLWTLKKSIFLQEKMMGRLEILHADSQRVYAEDCVKKKGLAQFPIEL